MAPVPLLLFASDIEVFGAMNKRRFGALDASATKAPEFALSDVYAWICSGI
jgi:hypothetical protein